MKRCPPACRPAHRGVTVVEAGIAAALIAVVSGGALMLFRGPDSAAQKQAALDDATVIRQAVQSWQGKGTRGCPTLSQLEHEQYLNASARTADPWGARFRVVCEQDTVVITSPGPDGKPGTRDDVRLAVD